MTGIDFKTFINGIGNDLKISIDDVIGSIITIHEDVEKPSPAKRWQMHFLNT